MSLAQPETDLRGLLVPERALLGATVSATSQAGARPGGAVPSGTYSLVLVTSGVLDQAVDDLTIVTQKAGGVGAATVRWRYTADDELRSWDPPAMISGWEFVSRSTTANKYTRLHVARRPSTGLAVVSATQDLTSVVVFRQDRFGKWLSSTVEATGDDTVSCLVPLANGRLLAFYTYAVGASQTQVRMAYSDDGGATWTVGSTECLATPLAKASDKYLRIRGAELNGLLAVLLHEQDTVDVVYQYVSSDGGGTLDEVDSSPGDIGWPDLAVSNGALYVALLRYDSSGPTLLPYVHRLTSASMPVSSADGVLAGESGGTTEWGVYSAGRLASGECALLADDDGTLWVYGVDFDAGSSKEVVTRLSRDGGATWTNNYASSHSPVGTVLFVGDSTSYLRDLAVAPERGRAILVHRMVAQASHDDSLCAAFLGGWSTVGMPENPAYAESVAGWEYVWIPVDEPDNLGWTLATSGTGTSTSSLGSTGLTVASGALENQHYTSTPTVAVFAEYGILAEFHVTMGSGTRTHEFRISDGVNDYTVRVHLTTTTITLRDVNAGADLVTVPASLGNGVVIRVALDVDGTFAGNDGRVRAWFRVDGPYIGGTVNYGPRQDREWTAVGSFGGGATVFTGLTSGAATTPRVRWGAILESGSATYRYFVYSPGLYTGGNIADSETGAERGARLPSAVSPLHLAEGLRVHGVGGPTMAGDTWTHACDYEYPAAALDPSVSPSPRRPWRSTSDVLQQDIVWSGLDLGWRPGDLLGICLVNANFPKADLYAGAGAATHVAQLDMRVQGLGFTRTRGQLVPAAGGASAPFHFSEGILRGARVNLGGSSIRKVRTNQAGAWLAAGTPGSYASARLQLEDYDGADPASGNLDLWMPGGLWITEAMVDTDTLTLRIPAQATVEDYFQLGTVLIGRVRVLQEYSWGRALQWTPAYQLETSLSGARSARALGPTRRAVDLAWDDGVHVIGLHTEGSAPDHYTAGYTGADAIAAPADTPGTLAGILAEVEGATLPVVYLPAIRQFAAATTAGSPYRDLDPNGWLYGRILTETLRVDNVLGHEQHADGQIVKVGQVRIEEEL